MDACPSCNAGVIAGMQWCPVCHVNVAVPQIGRLSSPIKRLGAHLVDLSMIVVQIFTGLAVIAAVIGSGDAGPFLLIVSFVVFIVFCVLSLKAFARGTTPGKGLFGMRVVKTSGESPGFLVMLIREAAKYIVSHIFFALGVFWILWDQDSQGWHDKLMNTYVVEGGGQDAAPRRGPIPNAPRARVEDTDAYRSNEQDVQSREERS